MMWRRMKVLGKTMGAMILGSKPQRMTKAEKKILALKKALAELEGEKEAGLLLYQQSLESLSKLDSEVSRLQESSQGLNEDLDELGAVNNDLEERLKAMENTHLNETLVMSNIEIKLVESVNGELDCQIRKGNEILEAKELFNAVQTEKTELQTMMKDMRGKYDEARVTIEDQANQILKLSSDKDCQHKELECLCEVNKKLQFEMSRLHEELGETKLREDNLSYQLHDAVNEIELWESLASKLYAQLQVSAVNATSFEGKVQELTQACERLERGSISKGIETEPLKERVVKLEGDNGRLRNELAAYVSAVSALEDSITSLEMQTLDHTKCNEYKESQANNLVNHQYGEANQQTSEDQNAVATDALPDFQNMQRRINAIEVAVKQMNESFKQKDEMREIQELRPGIGWHQRYNQASNLRIQTAEVKEHHSVLNDEQRIGKLVPGIHEAENRVLTKDIMPGQMSECSSYGLSRRGTLEADDRMLELWETADKDGNIGLTVGKSKAQKVATGPPDYNQRGAIKQQKNKHPWSESFGENELSVDKLEMPQRSSLPREEGNRRKILERLNSDAQKLANLEITVQYLIKKVEITYKTGKVKGVEYETVKGLIKVAEEAIMKLFDANRKLMKNVEEGNLSYVGKPATESDESGSISRRRVSEQARRGSERIGRLQVEVQRLQFLLLKLDDDKDIKAKTESKSPFARLSLWWDEN